MTNVLNAEKGTSAAGDRDAMMTAWSCYRPLRAISDPPDLCLSSRGAGASREDLGQ
jgi:hypothetical protein